MHSKVMVNGRSLAGKDTISDFLVEKYGFVKISFASPIYDIAREYFGMTKKDRKLLQDIGQHMREIDSDVWVRYAYRVANMIVQDGGRVVISDVRQSNEYVHGIINEFLPIRVTSHFDLRVQRAIERDGGEPDTSLWENKAETGADNFMYIDVNNNNTKEYLFKWVREIVQDEIDHYESIRRRILENSKRLGLI